MKMNFAYQIHFHSKKKRQKKIYLFEGEKNQEDQFHKAMTN